jgi:putative endonuclease
MAFYVYVLRSSKDNGYYIGISATPNKRLRNHNWGMTKSTKGRRPFKLMYVETVSSREEARKREKYLKSGVGREFIKKLFPGSSVGRAGGCASLPLAGEQRV